MADSWHAVRFLFRCFATDFERLNIIAEVFTCTVSARPHLTVCWVLHFLPIVWRDDSVRSSVFGLTLTAFWLVGAWTRNFFVSRLFATSNNRIGLYTFAKLLVRLVRTRSKIQLLLTKLWVRSLPL